MSYICLAILFTVLILALATLRSLQMNLHENLTPVSATDNTVAITQKSEGVSYLAQQGRRSKSYNHRFLGLVGRGNLHIV